MLAKATLWNSYPAIKTKLWLIVCAVKQDKDKVETASPN
jgi:hypothetical protein